LCGASLVDVRRQTCLREPAQLTVTALNRGQLEASERERKKSSVLSRLSRRQTFLFDALSASDWRDGNPKRTKEADMILEDRDMERNWNLLMA
jgi:hypothetical protein